MVFCQNIVTRISSLFSTQLRVESVQSVQTEFPSETPRKNINMNTVKSSSRQIDHLFFCSMRGIPHLAGDEVTCWAGTKNQTFKSEGHWLNPDLVGQWSHSPALPFPQHAQTNTFPILNPSVTLPLCRFLVFPYTPILPPRLFPLPLPPGRQTNLKCPPFSAYYFMTHSLTTHFFFCV